MKEMANLPVIQTSNSSFALLRKSGQLYVDKTAFLHSLISVNGAMCFFSRPRRFGKTLAVSTLEAIFQGKRNLFAGLAIDSLDYEWMVYPIIHIDFGECPECTSSGLKSWLSRKMLSIAASNSLKIEKGIDPSEQLSNLIDALSSEGNDVVVLIDEYDKVLSDHIFSAELEKMRDVLGNFYQVIKSHGSEIRFAFITGVTKYAKLSVFSKMNNLKDYSMNRKYSSMFGYTQEELESNFSNYIDQSLASASLSRSDYLKQLKIHYDGYRFCDDAEPLYNPVSIGNFFEDGGCRFDDYWIDTGNMKLLMDLSRKVDFNVASDLDEPMNQDSLNNFDITELASQNVTSSDLKSLLFQTGYLTIRSNYLDAFGSHGYYLDFPNLEVRRAFLFNLAMAYAPNLEDRVQAGNLISMIRNSASEGRTEQLIESLRIFLSCIPYDIQIKNEKYYQSLLVCVFKLLGLIVQSEVRTSSGRIDALIDAQCQMYVIEFKIDRSPDEALLQIKSKDYCLPFMHMKLTKTIHLLGIAFDSSKRNISDWKEELI